MANAFVSSSFSQCTDRLVAQPVKMAAAWKISRASPRPIVCATLGIVGLAKFMESVWLKLTQWHFLWLVCDRLVRDRLVYGVSLRFFAPGGRGRCPAGYRILFALLKWRNRTPQCPFLGIRRLLHWLPDWKVPSLRSESRRWTNYRDAMKACSRNSSGHSKDSSSKK